MLSSIPQKILQSLFFAVLIFLVFFPCFCSAASGPVAGEAHPEGFDQDRSAVYIIQMAEPPLLDYLIDRPRSPAFVRNGMGRRKPDFRTPGALVHLDRIRKQHHEFERKAEQALSRKLDVDYTYAHTFNGLAVRLTSSEADVVAHLPGVLHVQPEIIRFPLTDAGPAWVGAPAAWSGAGTGGIGTRGEGIVIAVLDTGIDPAHPSFDEIDGDAYVHTNPKGRFFGVCDESNGPLYDRDFPCNNKLIGAWSFLSKNIDPDSPRDSDGHGTHVAATAAGNALVTDALNPTQFGVTLSGVAPRANMIAYDVCVTDCPDSASLAAIDQAVADGVDVINFSIGGPPSDPWEDLVSLALLAAQESGIFVIVAAGNSGPDQGSITSPANAPWVTAVGDATHQRRFTSPSLQLSGPGAPPVMQGAGISKPLGPGPLVYALDFGDPLCLGPFTAGTWQNGEIIVCDRGEIPRLEKGINVKAGGAGGMVLVNQATDSGLVADFHVLPAIHISFNDGNALKTWLAAGQPGTLFGAIRGSERTLDPSFGDIVPSFSSRGPNRPAPGVLKPDLIAPGVLILAAGPPIRNESATFSVLTGTSASAPHVAGAAALLMSLHPEWTPDMIRSALMTTAEISGVTKENGAIPADPFDRGAGRIDLEKAARAGLALRESSANFSAADPTLGGDPTALNLPFLVDADCRGLSAWSRTFTSTLDAFSTWSVSTSAAPGMELTVSPLSFTLPPTGSVTLVVEADVRGLPENQWAFGEVVLSSQGGPESQIRLPAAVLVSAESSDPERVPGLDSRASRTPLGGGGGGGCMIGSLQSEMGFEPVTRFLVFVGSLLLLLAAILVIHTRRTCKDDTVVLKNLNTGFLKH
jgi:subtilisin family serine protease